MAKITVVLGVRADDGAPVVTEDVDGDSWSVDDNGVLNVFDDNVGHVASFAAGSWFRVLRKS